VDFKAQYLAAVKRDQDVRDAAFLGLTTNICEVEVYQLTLRDELILDGLGNPFISGGIHSVQDALKFLWLLSPDWKPGWWPAWRHGFRNRKLGDDALTTGINAYLDDTYQDAPGTRARKALNGPPFASGAAHFVHRLAKAYGWSLSEIMGTEKKRGIPLKVIFQLLKCIRNAEEENPELRSRRVLKARGDFLRAINARNSLLNLLRNRAVQLGGGRN